MGRIHTQAEAVIHATPAEVYAVLADYLGEHPRILPEEYFSDLEVESGGTGAGTVFKVRTRVMGVEQLFHMVVSEPNTGCVIVETDQLSGLVTKFILSPVNGGVHTWVQIITDWEAKGGLNGLMDRIFTPRIMRRIYTRQLAQLEAYMQSKKRGG